MGIRPRVAPPQVHGGQLRETLPRLESEVQGRPGDPSTASKSGFQTVDSDLPTVVLSSCPALRDSAPGPLPSPTWPVGRSSSWASCGHRRLGLSQGSGKRGAENPPELGSQLCSLLARGSLGSGAWSSNGLGTSRQDSL